YNVEATASSGLAVSFASTTEPVCTVAGSTVSLKAEGTCTIAASQPGDSEWEPAKQETQTFAVTRKPQTIMFTSTAPSNATVNAPTYAVTAIGGGSGNPIVCAIDSASRSVCTISGSTVSFTGAGTCTIDANQAGSAEYAPAAQVQQSFAVAAAPAPPSP